MICTHTNQTWTTASSVDNIARRELSKSPDWHSIGKLARMKNTSADWHSIGKLARMKNTSADWHSANRLVAVATPTTYHVQENDRASYKGMDDHTPTTYGT